MTAEQTSPGKRVGVFGGTFDPVHLGHLIVAEQCREHAQLDEVWFVPAASPPHKSDATIAPFAQRVEMLKLAVAGNPAFKIETIEHERSAPSYTAETLAELTRLHPGAELFLIVGSDTLQDLPNWYRPERVLQLATLLVMPRPDYPLPNDEEVGGLFASLGKAPLRMTTVAKPPLVSIASRDLRRRIAEGKSIRYLAPAAVECYVREKGLYQTP